MNTRRICLPFLILIVLFAYVTEVSAMNTGFKTSNLSAEEKNKFISNSSIALIKEEPEKKSVICFDVNNNNLIALGQNTTDRKTICIYSSNGVFQYGYTFACSGDFGIEWDENDLNIYFVRSGVLVSVSPNGEVIDVVKVENTTENNSYVNHFIHTTERAVGETTYSIKNNMGILNWVATSYSQVAVTDIAGEEIIIYDVSSRQRVNTVIPIIAVLLCFSVAIITIFRYFIKLK